MILVNNGMGILVGFLIYATTSTWFSNDFGVLGFSSLQPILTTPTKTSTSSLHRSSTLLQATIQAQQNVHKDIVIIGGGIAGLSAALYITQMDPKRHVTILEKEDLLDNKRKTTTASFAAAGMLAPQSERLPRGPLLDLCMESRREYRDFCLLIQQLAKQSGAEGAKFLDIQQNTNTDDFAQIDDEDVNVGYQASGGFLAPAFAGDSVATWAPPDDDALWLDEYQIRELEPQLHPDVVGGWWFPEDASVDARKLTRTLRAACVAAGVDIKIKHEVESLDLLDKQCRGVIIRGGKTIVPNQVLVANGAWMRQLLPVPIVPHKGQSLSLQMPSPPLLRRVLFSQDSYIVPKSDGRVVVGATVEAGTFNPDVTPAGLLHNLKFALGLVPALAELPVEETWVGMRPTTPDKGPILGETPWNNVYLAGGYWRNGVLLAPKTGQLLATIMTGDQLSKKDAKLLNAFAWDRFTRKGGGAKMAAESRYAAEFHPVHTRSMTTASVGTELGSYSSAKSAKEERAADRKAMLGEPQDDVFERAAMLGKADGKLYHMGDDDDDDDSEEDEDEDEDEEETFSDDDIIESEGSADDDVTDELDDLYQSVKDLKEKHTLEMNESPQPEEKPDPGFRTFHVDPDTGKETEVPPNTKLDEVSAYVKDEEEQSSDSVDVNDDQQEQKPMGVQDALDDIYQQVRENKEAVDLEMTQPKKEEEERPDPGFRLFLVDDEGGHHEVPPYTHPSEIRSVLGFDKIANATVSPALRERDYDEDEEEEMPTKSNDDQQGDSVLDGYKSIEEANSRSSRQEELEAMKEAREKNRIDSGIDVAKIGVYDMSTHKFPNQKD